MHRHIRMLLLMDVALGSLVARPWSSDGVVITHLMLWNIAFIFTIIAWMMFRLKHARGLRLAGIALVWFGTMLIAAGAEIVLDSVRIPDIGPTRGLEGLMLGALGFYSLFRIGILSDARFIEWYHDGSSKGKIADEPIGFDEYRAICPSCASLLAVRPSSLSGSDYCPHCSAPLVPAAISEEE